MKKGRRSRPRPQCWDSVRASPLRSPGCQPSPAALLRGVWPPPAGRARSAGDGAALTGVSPARPRLVRPRGSGACQRLSSEPLSRAPCRRSRAPGHPRCCCPCQGESWETVRTSLHRAPAVCWSGRALFI